MWNWHVPWIIPNCFVFSGNGHQSSETSLCWVIHFIALFVLQIFCIVCIHRCGRNSNLGDLLDLRVLIYCITTLLYRENEMSRRTVFHVWTEKFVLKIGSDCFYNVSRKFRRSSVKAFSEASTRCDRMLPTVAIVACDSCSSVSVFQAWLKILCSHIWG